MTQSTKSWWARTFGRSIFSMVFGKFFETKNNAAGIIAVSLVLTLCYIVISKISLITDMDKITDGVLNVIFVVVGYYFGAKQQPVDKEDDE